jgi:GAF domain-containing protein
MTIPPELLAALAAAGQPHTLFAALDRATQASPGHRLLTLNSTDGRHIARAYSSRPAEYAVGGRKTVGATAWDDLVIRGGKPFLGPDRAAIRGAFPDAPLIESMGLGAVINIPVVYDGRTIGTMNLLDAEHRYTEADLPRLIPLAALLIPAFLAATP